MKKVFAIDYDGTYTMDPELWLMIIKLIIARGHDVVIATMRTESECHDIDQRLKDIVRIIPTHRQSKMKYLSDLGIFPSIWIDDMPIFILENGTAPA